MTPDDYTFTGSHADVLPGGQPVAPGDTVTSPDLDNEEIRRLVDDGVLQPQDQAAPSRRKRSAAGDDHDEEPGT